MQVELLRPRRRPSALWGGGGRGDECRHLARHGSGLRPAAGLRRLGHGPLLVLRYDLRPARRAAAGKASGTEDLGRRCWWRSKPTWRHRPGRARATARSGLGFRSVATSGLPASGCSDLMRENNLLGRPIAAAAVAAIPMTVRSSLMPRTSCGAPMAFGCSRWTTAGAGSSPPSSIGTPSVSAGMSAARRPLRRPAADLHGAPGCMARPRPARLLALWMDHGSQFCLTTSPTRSSSGASSRPTPSSPSDQRPPSGSIAR